MGGRTSSLTTPPNDQDIKYMMVNEPLGQIIAYDQDLFHARVDAARLCGSNPGCQQMICCIWQVGGAIGNRQVRDIHAPIAFCRWAP
jgi:hypothetical protein